MTIRGDLEHVIRNELEPADHLLRHNDVHRARQHVQTAISRLKEIERKVNRLEMASRK